MRRLLTLIVLKADEKSRKRHLTKFVAFLSIKSVTVDVRHSMVSCVGLFARYAN